MARSFLYCRWRKLPDFSLGANFFRGSCHSGASRLVISVQPKPRSMDMTQVTDPFAAAREVSERPVGRIAGEGSKPGPATEETSLGNAIADAQLFATRSDVHTSELQSLMRI